MKKILITTGGTGGHVMPALNIFDHLNKKFDVKIVTDIRGKKFINKNKYSFDTIKINQISKNFFKLPFSLALMFISIIKGYLYLKKNKIKLVISTGGYMSLPFCLSAKFLNISIILFEPNMVLGRSNKYFLKFANKIICYSKKIMNFPDKYINKIFLTETILKKDIYDLNIQNGHISEVPKILVIGGSQGAMYFDKTIQEILIDLNKIKKINIYQQVSDESKIDEIKKTYAKNNIPNSLFTFKNDIYEYMSKCDLAISRCGASTLSELVKLCIPFIGIPLPSAKDNHQYFNAKYYEEKNCCWLVNQANFEKLNLISLLKKIISSDTVYQDKYSNLKNISYQNKWDDINKKLIKLINEN